MALGKKDPSYFSGICDILRACKEADVLELHLEGLSVFRTLDAQFNAFASRRPLPREGLPQAAPEAPPLIRESLQAQEASFRDDVEANLALEDPVEWERQQMAELDGKVTAMTAEQISDLDEEEAPT